MVKPRECDSSVEMQEQEDNTVIGAESDGEMD